MLKMTRQSGRTTRMLEEATKLRDEGRAVYVLLANQRHVALYKNDPRYEGVRFETLESLGPSGVDEHRLTLRGAHPNCVLLVDHFFVEDRYRAALSWLARYDS